MHRHVCEPDQPLKKKLKHTPHSVMSHSYLALAQRHVLHDSKKSPNVNLDLSD